ncbi:MAG: sugar phosphate isomerase/epimerase family protein [Roseibacillus sp.]|jgi:sugar phosphate isomerase/epimerase
MNRRRFLATGVAASAPALSFAQFPERKGAARMHVGLAAYSFRDQFAWMKGKARKVGGEKMDMFSFVDYCADHGCHGAELTSYFFPADADAAYYHRLKRHAFLRGVEVCGTAIGNDFSRGKSKKLDDEVSAAKGWLDKAVQMGAPHVRFFAGTGKGFAAGGERVDAAITALKSCAKYAGERGVFIGIENHGGITAELLLRLVVEVDSPWVGINLDSGNFISDDSYADFERCAPFAVNVQLKTHMRGHVKADLPRLIGLLRAARYQGYVVLEYESGKPEEIPGYLATLRQLCSPQ